MVHAAAIPRPTGRVASDVFSTNMALAFNVVEAAVLILGIRGSSMPRPSACSAFPSSRSRSISPICRSTRPIRLAPQDAYALSKMLGEEIVDAAVRRGGLDAVSLRMPWIQTPGDLPRRRSGRAGASAESAARSLWCYIDARDAGGGAFRGAVERRTTGHLRLYRQRRRHL